MRVIGPQQEQTEQEPGAVQQTKAMDTPHQCNMSFRALAVYLQPPEGRPHTHALASRKTHENAALHVFVVHPPVHPRSKAEAHIV
jgi:hypothetical protein